MGIQFAIQLFSTVPSPTRLGRQLRPTVTGTNRHQKKYEVRNPKVSSLSLPGPRNWRRQWMRWPKTRYRQCVPGIRYSGTTTVGAASWWRALVVGEHSRGVGRVRRTQGINNDTWGVNWGIRRYNTSEWTYAMSGCLRRRRRWCVYRYPEVSMTTTEASIEEADNTMRRSERL